SRRAGSIPCRIARTAGGSTTRAARHCSASHASTARMAFRCPEGSSGAVPGRNSRPPQGWRPSSLGELPLQLPPRGSGLTGEPAHTDTLRSEEHTSELQSRENLVCRLLLEKKNKRWRNAPFYFSRHYYVLYDFLSIH